ncbi:MAG: histidine kinase dimerization/phospho-acceptor domain-containing protein [Dehalococcoidia bacterium]|nr:histidine kinase dimerization/phospho-acceptor domain-containing protein [Dehalococcoidia bacterium]
MQTIEKAGREIVSSGHVSSGDEAVTVNARMELVGRVAAGLAHDLNGPIGVMLGFTQLAKEKLESDGAPGTDGLVEYLKMIESAGENARSLARDMWDFAKAESGESVEFDFANLLETSLRLVAPSLRVAAIEPPEAGELPQQIVTGDRALWAQAMVGVMINAPAALPGGGSLTWKMQKGADGTSLAVEFIASPNDPKTSATPPAATRDWGDLEPSMAIIRSLGGILGPLSGLDDERRGIEISVPIEVCRG